jgi:hypothetical protein
MTIRGLLIELTRQGIALSVSDGQLRYSAPEGVLTNDLKRDLAAHKQEILAMYSGSPIFDVQEYQLSVLWNAFIECRGEGDAAWAWIKASQHWLAITAAEAAVNRIGTRGDPDDLNAACQEWLAAWVVAMREWTSRGNEIRRTTQELWKSATTAA